MKFAPILLSFIVFLLSRLSPSPDPVPAAPSIHYPHSIRFAPPQLSLRAGDLLLSNFSNRSHLLLKFSRVSKSVLFVVLLAGDIELNPGPKWKFPCGSCAGPVRSNQKGIFCDVCGMWFHTRCIGLSNDEYSSLQASPDAWACRRCLSEALPFHSSSCPPSPSPTNQPDQGKPMQISQPRHQSLNILYTNCRSLYNKLDDLRCLTSQHLPHIICLCETWLDDTILDNELRFHPSS